VFGVLACGIMSTLGLVAGLWAEKFDQLAVFQNFLIMPLSFLSGVFYSTHSLPAFWQAVSQWNPVFYMIDGMRYGFFGVSDTSPWLSLLVVSGVFIFVSIVALRLIVSGYKLRN
jgi:ABC-2 type transport system permease protein